MIKNKNIFALLSFLFIGLLAAVAANASTVQRSNFLVDNLTCTSCLANIEAELRGLPGALGMKGDLREGRVTVDHLATLDPGEIGALISRLGYPATLDWTATVPEQFSEKFAAAGSYRSGCSSGGCGLANGPGAGITAWKSPPAEGTANRTTLRVTNLSCTSCLANIATELSKLSETYGMSGYLSRGVVIVDHAGSLESSRIATIVSGLGYPAKVTATNEIPAQNVFGVQPAKGPANPPTRLGRGCGGRGPCNATSSSWKKLYNRYVTQLNSNKELNQ